jgi:hypothetical protein
METDGQRNHRQMIFAAGIEVGDVFLSIDGIPVKDVE